MKIFAKSLKISANFQILENIGKSLNISASIFNENTDKNGAEHAFIWKNGANLCRITWRPLFGVHPKDGRYEKIIAQKVTQIFRASLGKFGQKSFAPPKICLLVHLCLWSPRTSCLLPWSNQYFWQFSWFVWPSTFILFWPKQLWRYSHTMQKFQLPTLI